MASPSGFFGALTSRFLLGFQLGLFRRLFLRARSARRSASARASASRFAFSSSCFFLAASERFFFPPPRARFCFHRPWPSPRQAFFCPRLLSFFSAFLCLLPPPRASRRLCSFEPPPRSGRSALLRLRFRGRGLFSCCSLRGRGLLRGVRWWRRGHDLTFERLRRRW